MVDSFKICVITDTQFADIDDAYNFTGVEKRSYRGAKRQLADAVAYWNDHAPDAKLILQLGDLIDGQNSGTYGQGEKWKDAPRSKEALEEVLAVLGDAKCTRHVHVIGNHELYNFTREELAAPPLALADPDTGKFYRTYSPCPGWRFVILDTYDISIIGRPKGSPEYEQALEMIKAHNHNPCAWGEGVGNYFEGLENDEQKRFVPYNGGLGAEQMAWLEDTLARTVKAGEVVVVCTHVPLSPTATGWHDIVFNFRDVRAVLATHAYKGGKQGGVAAVFSGHYHPGGYDVDDAGIHHVVFPAPLTTAAAYCYVQLATDALEVVAPPGSGIPRRTLPLPGTPSAV